MALTNMRLNTLNILGRRGEQQIYLDYAHLPHNKRMQSDASKTGAADAGRYVAEVDVRAHTRLQLCKIG